MDKKKIMLVGSDSAVAQDVITGIFDNGDNLFTLSRSHKKYEKVVEHFCIDLKNTQQIINYKESLMSKQYDVFIYCAGIFNPKKITELNSIELQNEIKVNMVAPILLSSFVLPGMIKKEEGTMIFLGSSSAYEGFKNSSIYCSSKHGLLGYCRSLAEEYRSAGIKVSCISSGTINTKMSIALNKVHNSVDPNTFIDVKEVSKLILDLIYSPTSSMWQEEIILKRRSY